MEEEDQNCYQMKKANHFHMHHVIGLDQEIIQHHDPLSKEKEVHFLP